MLNTKRPEIYEEAIRQIKEAKRNLELIWADEYAEQLNTILNALNNEWDDSKGERNNE